MFQPLPIHEFDWERDQHKEECIVYDKASMPVKNDALNALVERLCAIPSFDSLIAAKMPAKRVTARNKLKVIMTSLIWHFYLATKLDRDLYVSISMSSNDYPVKSIENPYNIPRKITEVVSWLDKERLIDFHIGFTDRETKKARFTRIRPTVKLRAVLETLPRDIKRKIDPPQPLSFRDTNKKHISVPADAFDDPDVQDAQTVIEQFNAMVADADIGTTSVNKDYLKWRNRRGDPQTTDLSNRFLRAVIYQEDDKSFTYFRMHGGFWQHMPSRLRNKIRINGEKCVCLDYSAQVLNIVASLSEVQISDDAYNVDLGGVNLDADEKRSVVKLAVVIFLNEKSEEAGYSALRSKLRKEASEISSKIRLTDNIFDKVRDALLNSYPFLKGYLFKANGLSLFNHDAEIARGIMKVFHDRGEVVLPIHDGFIVNEKNHDLLRSTMNSVWAQKFKTTINVKREFLSKAIDI